MKSSTKSVKLPSKSHRAKTSEAWQEAIAVLVPLVLVITLIYIGVESLRESKQKSNEINKVAPFKEKKKTVLGGKIAQLG